MSEPRHRRESGGARLSPYTAPIPVRNIDFDAVAPMRRPEPYVPAREPREPSGDGPAQYEPDDVREDETLHLAHS